MMQSVCSSDRNRKVAVIMINFRTPGMTIDALRSIWESGDVDLVNAVVIDNDSQDGSIETIRGAITRFGWKEWCSAIESPSNDGFSAGNNLGIRSQSAEYYLLLNSDTLVRPNAISTLVQRLESEATIGMVSPRLEWPDGTAQVSCFRFIRPTSELIRAAATGPITRTLRSADIPWDTDSQGGHEACRPDWTSFACVLIRGEVIRRVGLMDDGFFMYFDDVDYCRLARRCGYVIDHCPDARVVHLRGGSSNVKRLQSKRQRRPRYYYAARSRYYAKHFGRIGLTGANLYWMLGYSISQVRRLFGISNRNHCRSEWRDIWTNWWHPKTGANR